MANPFQDKQNTTGGKAGFASFNELTFDKAYDDETLTDNPGAPLPIPVANPPQEFIQGRQVDRPDYEGQQLQKFKDVKKTCEAMDDILEREYIDIINSKKTQIVTIMTEAFGAIPTSDPPANKQLILPESTAPTTGIVYQSGIGSVSYATDTSDPAGDIPIFGAKGQIFPDILAAFHYPALSNGSHGDTDLPLANGTFIRVSRTITGSGEYSASNLGIGQTIYHSGDNDYAGAVGVVTSQTPLGNFYFFGGTVTNNIGANIDVVRAGSSTSISNIITEINDLRSSLRVRIGPPQVNNNAGINTLRSTKLQDELAVWYDDAGNRTSNIQDFQGGIDSLVGNAPSISAYNG
jgi:hypothetical protein|tara:strand:+ start:144 stop:1190 length:1047 start_codon:yes stop_codon:yes gene_type:complete